MRSLHATCTEVSPTLAANDDVRVMSGLNTYNKIRSQLGHTIFLRFELFHV